MSKISHFLIVFLLYTVNGIQISSQNDKIQRFSTDRVVCPGDKNQTCADGYTCCPGKSEEFNCCPHLQAACCPDLIHCCPMGSTCDPAGGRCLKLIFTTPVEDIACPGDEFRCPVKSTCCKVSGGQYGCCPFDMATCCPDQLHCCPEGYECGGQNTCVHSNGTTLFQINF